VIKTFLSHKVVRIVYHILFWVACFLVLFSLFTKDHYNGPIDYAFTLVFIIPLIASVYVGLFGLRKLVKQQKVFYFLLLIGLAMIIGVGGHYLSYNHLSDFLFPRYLMSSYYSVSEVVQYVLVFLTIACMLKLSKDWFLLKSDQLELEQEHHSVQLKELRSKLNPHFLFNSLNNIYALTEDNPARSQDYILRLSSALRYMIYETDEEKVPLQSELDYMLDYVELEKLRIEDDSDITIHVPDNTADLIAPLLLLPLFENCFKYVDKQNAKVLIDIKLEDDTLFCVFENSRKDIAISGLENGVGLSTLEKRLDLLYPNKHKYEVTTTHKKYRAELKLDLR